jgi:(R,R)-butanediol dehydrogenase / meso-butanediol dehydrogenase / diacetyl reductase
MKALRFYGRGDLRVEDIAEPSCVIGTVKIAVEACGICGSDLSSWTKGPTSIPVDRPDPRTGVQAPVTIGHEVVGRILEMGEGVEGFALGDRVVIRGLDGCGSCDRCIIGQSNFCRRLWQHGFNTASGGFSEVEVVPVTTVHRVPDSVGVSAAALIEPFCVALHAVRRSGFAAGDSVVAFGGGPIGLLGVECLRLAGAASIILVEPSRTRREAGLRAGADVVVNPSDENVLSVVDGITKGRGADLAFEFAGAPRALEAALLCVRPQGTIVNVASWRKPVEIDPMNLLMAERSLVGVLGYTKEEFDFAITLMSTGRLSPEWLVSRTISLDDSIERGFMALADNSSGDLIKVIVRI